MNEGDKIKTQIVGVDNPSNITNVKVLSGEVILAETVKQRIQQGQKFSVVDPETKQTVDVVVGADGVLKMKDANGTEKTLDKLPTFT